MDAIILRKKYRDYYALWIEKEGELFHQASGPFLFCLSQIPEKVNFHMEHLQ